MSRTNPSTRPYPQHQAIAACHGAGVRVVMITGDHVRTATSIARSIGILHPEWVIFMCLFFRWRV